MGWKHGNFSWPKLSAKWNLFYIVLYSYWYFHCSTNILVLYVLPIWIDSVFQIPFALWGLPLILLFKIGLWWNGLFCTPTAHVLINTGLDSSVFFGINSIPINSFTLQGESKNLRLYTPLWRCRRDVSFRDKHIIRRDNQNIEL